jgi:hypothetical protein
LAGCASIGYDFAGIKSSPDIEGDLMVTCYAHLAAARNLVSADEIRWERSEHSRLVRR